MPDCAVSPGGVHTAFCSASPDQTLAFSTLCTPPEDPEASKMKKGDGFKQTTEACNNVQHTSRPNGIRVECDKLYLLVE